MIQTLPPLGALGQILGAINDFLFCYLQCRDLLLSQEAAEQGIRMQSCTHARRQE